MSDFIDDKDDKRPSVFLQWKGTDACLDFYCGCGAHCHFDGYFAYVLRCPHCSALWEMPCMLFPRKADDKTYHIDMAQDLEPDEDFLESKEDTR